MLIDHILRDADISYLSMWVISQKGCKEIIDNAVCQDDSLPLVRKEEIHQQTVVDMTRIVKR